MISFPETLKSKVPKLKTKDLVKSRNIAKELDEDLLTSIGLQVVEGCDRDFGTRKEWEQRNEKGMKLALQVVEEKSFPWVKCANVKFPLLTIAALQFLARIALMTKGRTLVKLDVVGSDPMGHRAMQAIRVSNHISYQMTEQDPNWITADEKCKFACAIVGTAFKKTYYDSVEGINRSVYVPAQNFVVDYYCEDLETSDRYTEIMMLSENKVQEGVRRGIFCKMKESDIQPPTPEISLLEQASDEAAGLSRPADNYGTPYEFLEQYTWIDLDGDGYAEPYIITVRRDTKQVFRIVARYFDSGDVIRVNDVAVRLLEQEIGKLEDEISRLEDAGKAPPKEGEASVDSEGKVKQLMALLSQMEKEIHKLENAADNHIIRILPDSYYTKYSFVPSPDGGFYDFGLGALLGANNEAANTVLNQLLDAGTMGNLGGGFLGRGVKMKGGTMTFAPGEWKPVDSTGNDLKNNIVPLMTAQPSPVLFQLLGLLIGYAEKISGATDIMTGTSPGQNTPAETTRTTVEQGMMLFSGVYARMYRGLKAEIRKMYDLNRLYFHQSPHFAKLTQSEGAIVAPDDYDNPNFIVMPAASPEDVTPSQRKAKAMNTYMLAKDSPGMNMYLAKRKVLEAWEEEDIDRLLPDPEGKNAIQPPPNLKMEELKLKRQEHEDGMQLEIAKLQQQSAINQAKIAELQAKAAKEIEDAKGVKTGHMIAMLDAQIGAARAEQEGVLKSLELLQKAHAHKGQMEVEHKKIEASHGDNGRGSEPMV